MMEFEVDEDGIFNVVVFWFKFELDDENELTISSYVGL